MSESPLSRPDFATATRYWLRLGLLNFGGPAGQIAMMQRDLVEERRWIDQPHFLQALNFCMVLPGPEAQQLATYIGWLLHGARGAVIAGVLFVLPGAVVLFALSWLAAAHGDAPLIRAAFDGLKPIVVAIVVEALWRISRRTLRGWIAAALAVGAFVAIQFLGVPFPLIVLTAGTCGWFFLRTTHVAAAPAQGPPSPGRALRLAAVYVVMIAVPTAALVGIYGRAPFLEIAQFFTQAAFVTFGGAYAVLPYVAKEAVESFHWLSSSEMINGLALAETTPGPLILVLQYVGFFAGWNHPPVGLMPFTAATIGAVLTSYATFLPSIFLILIGAPYVAWIANLPRLSSAFRGITAAVVGVIGSLGWFFGSAVFFVDGRVDLAAVAIALAALVAGLRFKVSMPLLVLAGAVVGVLRAMAGGAL